jgi:hypothetical protein
MMSKRAFHQPNLEPEAYKPQHAQIYSQVCLISRTGYAPPSRQAVEKQLADFAERDEDNYLLGEAGSLASTVRERSKSTINNSMVRLPEAKQKVKTLDYYRSALRAKEEVKNLALVPPPSPRSTPPKKPRHGDSKEHSIFHSLPRTTCSTRSKKSSKLYTRRTTR